MNTWYLVKKNWPNIETIAARYGKSYIGLGGDSWPGGMEYGKFILNEFDQIEKTRTYVEIKHNGLARHEYVTTDKESAIAYLNAPNVKEKNAILIQIQYAFDALRADVDGYDFGNPAGGYSVIETEIILKDSRETIDTYLNEFCLFDSMDSMRGFLLSLKDAARRGECEELDNYVPVAIKRWVSPSVPPTLQF